MVGNDKLLKVMEGQVVVTKKVSTLASEDVGLLEAIIKIQSNREVFHGLIKDGETGKGPSSC